MMYKTQTVNPNSIIQKIANDFKTKLL